MPNHSVPVSRLIPIAVGDRGTRKLSRIIHDAPTAGGAKNLLVSRPADFGAKSQNRDQDARCTGCIPPGVGGGAGGLPQKLEEHVKHAQGATPNLDAVYSHQLDNSLYLQFRSGDVSAETWIQRSRLEQFFDDLTGLIYF